MDSIKCNVKNEGLKTVNKYSDGFEPRNCDASHLKEMTQDMIKINRYYIQIKKFVSFEWLVSYLTLSIFLNAHFRT
jgi:hypothetical protein